MRRQQSLILAAAISLFVTNGCKPSSHPPQVVNAAYGKVELGMSIDDAKAVVAGEDETRSYDNLPASPKPREIYSKLPASIEWRVWAAAGKPTLIIGVVDGKVAFKQVLWKDGGEFKSDTSALPAYQ